VRNTFEEILKDILKILVKYGPSTFFKMRRMTGGGSFRYTVWDPFMILSQMSTLQCLYYVSLGIWIFIFDVLSGTPRSLDHIFQYQVDFPKNLVDMLKNDIAIFSQTLLAGHIHGKLLIAAFLFNALTCSLGLWYVVQRTKLCLVNYQRNINRIISSVIFSN